MRSHKYYMLVASLPALPARFEADCVLMAPERLRMRLRLLEPEDAGEVGRMLDVLRWSWQFEEARDAAVVARYGELLRGIATPLARELLAMGMDLRMVVAALRRRHRGMGPPTVGFGQWFEPIRRHFDQPDFGLAHVVPWISSFDRLIDDDDALALYRRVLEESWAYLRKKAQDYDTFSFDSVVIYIARWDIIRRWQQLQPGRGQVVFEALVKEAMGEHAELYS